VILTGLKAAVGCALLGMVALNVVNAAGRYLAGFVMVGADELLVFAMIAVVMGGAVVATAERRHLALNLLPSRLGRIGRPALTLALDLVAAASCAYAAVQSAAFVGRLARLGQSTMGLGIPAAIPHGMLLLGLAGMALLSLGLALREIARLLPARIGPEVRP
jgi:TRAP-type C4-dicarboxylate transport system permease small subunit